MSGQAIISRSKAIDIAYVRFRAPDLDLLRQFGESFGLATVSSSADSLYMRGARSAPFLYAASLGEPAYAGVGFRLTSASALSAFAAASGAAVEPLDGPAPGKRVRLTDPDGFAVEAVVFDEAASPPATPFPASEPVNEADIKRRQNREKRREPGPSDVFRLGHVVLNVSDFARSEAWYKEMFGFITSDEIIVPGGASIGAFMRCDRGEDHTDHHTVFLIQSPTPGFNHAAFEVRDLDSLMTGHDHLASHGYQHRWGVGRHVLGSQIFDYWRDPWGHVLEHWTDGDLMNAAWGSRKSSFDQLRAVQWGHGAPHDPPPVPTKIS